MEVKSLIIAWNQTALDLPAFKVAYEPLGTEFSQFYKGKILLISDPT